MSEGQASASHESEETHVSIAATRVTELRDDEPAVRRLAGRLVRDHPVAVVFVVALLARLVVVTYVAVRHGGYLFEDDLGYVSIAADAATSQTATWDDYTHSLYDGNATLLYPMTALFSVFGPHAVLGQLYVALAGALAAALVTRLALELAARGPAVVAGLWVAVLPSQVLFSSLTLKDALVWAALAGLAVLTAVAGRAHGRRLLAVAALAVVVLVLLGYLRQHTLVVALWALALTAWTGDRRDRVVRVAGALCLAVAVPWMLGAGPAGASIVRGAGSLETQRALGAQGAATALVAPAPSVGETESAAEAAKRVAEASAAAALAEATDEALAIAESEAQSADSARRAAAERRVAAARAEAQRARMEAKRLAEAAAPTAAVAEPADRAGSVFGATDDASATRRNLAYLPRGLTTLVLRPLPWESTENRRLQMAKAENLLWYPLLALALLGVLGLRRHGRVLAFPLVIAAGTAVMWALVEGNFGTAYRHRGEFVWAAAALASGGIAELAHRFNKGEPLAATAVQQEARTETSGTLA